MKLVVVFFILYNTATSFAQTLSIEQFLNIIRQNHPVVSLSKIEIEKVKAKINIAKGAFNPILETYVGRKTLDQETYYRDLSPSLNIPTWFGLDFHAGIEQLSGSRTSPVETLGQSSYLGFSVPLAKNLLLDKRRAALQQSKIFQNMAILEQATIINDILMDAAAQYWQWYNAFLVLKTLDAAELVANRRLDFVRQSFLNGERPAIDTLEAITQYQNLLLQRTESQMTFINEGLMLSTFLWLPDNIPYQLSETIEPSTNQESELIVSQFTLDLSELLQSAEDNHPVLAIYREKSNILLIDKKLKFQSLLPKADFTYNIIDKDFVPVSSEGLFFRNNYQYGLKFSMPLLFSTAKGEYRQAKLKISENQIMTEQKKNELLNKIRLYHNEYLNYQNQIKTQEQMLQNFQNLLIAEETLLFNGESSLFLINSRENKVLETQKKLIELKTKYFKSIYSVRWSAGLLQ
ncbi:MAG: TolC family protein [Saprospiraceae bacterium]